MFKFLKNDVLRILDETQNERVKLEEHRLYYSIQSLDDLKIFMENISLKGKMNFDNQEDDINEIELSSLKITDSLYKKDIGKFLEILSSHFI